ncbi:hypothetical protein RJ639_037134 [Escallonia herrerae]|uniref:Uncharacterized protein n=1 Tax=Escallonia herrerae TaxID=1293975 RepID=A0AA88X6L8_9ASTE|nr:hypothetical protein RJ639_037134 [Escallonia herrerae]
MAIVERLKDFKQGERPRSPRHERAKDGRDGRSKSGSPKAIDDKRSRDEGHHCHHKKENKHKKSRKWGDSRDHKAHVGPRKGCFYCAVKGKAAKGKKIKKRQSLFYAMIDIAEKTQEVLVDTGATHNFMSPRFAEWLGPKPTKDGSCFMVVNAEERPAKGVVKNVDLRIGGWTGKADFNIIDTDKLGVVIEMEFMEKLSTTLNPYCGVMMMAGKEGQLEWMIPLVSKDGVDIHKGINILQLDKGSMLCYSERQMGLRTYTVYMLTKTVTAEKFKHYLSLIHRLSCRVRATLEIDNLDESVKYTAFLRGLRPTFKFAFAVNKSLPGNMSALVDKANKYILAEEYLETHKGHRDGNEQESGK